MEGKGEGGTLIKTLKLKLNIKPGADEKGGREARGRERGGRGYPNNNLHILASISLAIHK